MFLSLSCLSLPVSAAADELLKRSLPEGWLVTLAHWGVGEGTKGSRKEPVIRPSRLVTSGGPPYLGVLGGLLNLDQSEKNPIVTYCGYT
jgi:hypothetical protein